ncbi:hypothetical protein HHL11_29250 [Ramlibacter sp. G-1-2-2]|uniref:Uncharacterized protein n=1 Tax=Ramlibacter agri TaxID=2728837 RepID=A0A848HCL2_9BURK|nr:hypothetical protein [Ramlibacter agri]
MAPLAAAGTGMRTGSIKPDQGYWASVGAIANSDISFGDKLDMAWGATKYYLRGSNEVQGSVQMISGGFEVAGAITLSSTGLGATLGVPLAFHGGDSIGTGLRRALGYGSDSTATYQVVESTTGSSTLASAVDQIIPFAGGVATVGQGLRLAEERVLANTVFRGLTPVDATALEEGAGLTAKNPNGIWTAEDHVANYKLGTRGGALRNDPWIGTTRDYEVVVGPNGYDSGNGIVAINLKKVPNAKVEVWPTQPRSNIYNPIDPQSTMLYHRSIWAQEVSIFQSVSSKAIYTPFSPASQVPAYRNITYGLSVGSSTYSNQRRGSQ